MRLDTISATLGLFRMTAERWKKINKLFSIAQGLPEAEREEFFLRECGDDLGLKNEVEKLLVKSVYEGEITAAMGVSSHPAKGSRYAAGGLINERYEIIHLLGRGGMGEVYLANDNRINRNVALKVLHPDLVSSAESMRRFEREAQAVSVLNHPHIMTIYEFDKTDDGSSFIVSEFIDGKSLNRLIGSGIDSTRALDIAMQAASALSAAHEAGITHRDVKPENIMVRPDGYIKVLDFGLAKLTDTVKSAGDSSGSEDPTIDLHKTRPGAVMGTAAYMSPEQARGLNVDARADIWSLGVVLYEMLTGHRPFAGETSADVIVAVLLNEPPPISAYFKELPTELEWIVSKSLSKNVDARYQTTKEFRADLDKIKRRIELEATSRQSGEALQVVANNSAAVPTADGAAPPTDDGKIEKIQRSWPSNSFHRVVSEARTHKVSFSLASLAVIAVLISATYFGLASFRRSPAIDSVAVLPFDNLSGDPEIAAIAGGLSEALIDRFAQLPQLKVISRRSSFKFSGPDIDVRDVASQLGVRAVVTGTISKVGDQIVVRIDVVDAVENRQISGGTYQRTLAELVRLSDDIANATVGKLNIDLTIEQSRRLAKRDTENSESFRYYLNGLVVLNGADDGRAKARAFFEKAIELDPEFALVYAEIAWLHWGDANASSDPAKVMPKARAAADRALSIDPDLAKAHVAKAFVYEYDFDWVNAEKEYQRAIELSPNLDFARNNYAFFLSVLDRQSEATAQLEEQRTRDPLNQRLGLLQKAVVLVQARRFDEALQTYQAAQALDPAKPVPYFALAYAYDGKGLTNDAIAYYKKAVDELGGPNEYSQALVYLAAIYAKQPEHRDEARAILTRIEGMSNYTSPALLATIYARLDDTDKAMDLLERAYVDHDLLLRYIRTGFEYDRLRSDPRFVDLERRIGLRK